jgi:hypothetical protein
MKENIIFGKAVPPAALTYREDFNVCWHEPHVPWLTAALVQVAEMSWATRTERLSRELPRIRELWDNQTQHKNWQLFIPKVREMVQNSYEATDEVCVPRLRTQQLQLCRKANRKLSKLNRMVKEIQWYSDQIQDCELSIKYLMGFISATAVAKSSSV